MNKKTINYFRNNISISLVSLFLLMLIGAFFEVIGIGLFIPLLNNNTSSEFLIIIKELFSFFSLQYNNINLAVLLIGIFILKFLVINIQNFMIYKASYNFLHNVKVFIMSNIYTMKFKVFLTLGIDELNNIFTKEIEKSSLSIRYFLQIGVNSIYAIFYFIFALYINYIIVCIALLLGLLVVRIQKIITVSIIKYSKKVVEGNEDTNLIVLQILNSLKYIISTNRFNHNNLCFNEVSKKYSENSEKMSFLNSIPKNTPEFIGVFIVSLMIIINEMSLKENIVTVVFLGLVLYRMVVRILSVQKIYQTFLINIGSIEKIINLNELIMNNQTKHVNISKKIDNIDNIEINNVFVEFDKKNVLSNISLELRKNNIYAIVGESGSGKSTLLNALTLLYDLKKGKIKVNNLLIENIDVSSYRDRIGYVSQEPIIFEGTVKENILFGEKFNEFKYNKLINDIGIDSFEFNELTMSGTNISGGQRQIISLARELYKNPDILILDEFTSALDPIFEMKVTNIINNFKKDKIIIIVAHRLSSIIKSNQVVLIQNGKIIAKNKFEDLYFSNDYFKDMANKQNIYLEFEGKIID